MPQNFVLPKLLLRRSFYVHFCSECIFSSPEGWNFTKPSETLQTHFSLVVLKMNSWPCLFGSAKNKFVPLQRDFLGKVLQIQLCIFQGGFTCKYSIFWGAFFLLVRCRFREQFETKYNDASALASAIGEKFKQSTPAFWVLIVRTFSYSLARALAIFYFVSNCSLDLYLPNRKKVLQNFEYLQGNSF